MAVGRYSTRRRNRSGLAYFVLTIIFVFLVLKWGIPLFVNLIAGPTGTRGGLLNSNEDTIPPQTPILSALAEATNSAEALISGYTEPLVEISVWRNEEMQAGGRSDDQGKFGVYLTLIDGENRVRVKARDRQGNESESAVKVIVYDKSEIMVTIDSPADGSEFFGKTNQNLAVSGRVNKPEAAVTVNGNFARVDAEGKFSVVIRLNEGDNAVRVRAIGKAGNITERTIKVALTL